MTAPPAKFSASQLDSLQIRLISSLKQPPTPSKSSKSPPVTTSGSLNDVIAILSELRDHMPQIVHNPILYERLISQWVSLFKDMLVDTSLGDIKKKQKKVEDKQKDGKDVSKAGAAGGVVAEEKANEKLATNKAHPYYIRPNPLASSQQNSIRRSLLEILCRCPLNDQMTTSAAAILSICVNVLLGDYEGNALLATSLIFQLHKAYRLVGSPHSSNTTSISRMKGEDARQLRECQVFLDFVCDCYKELNKSDGGSLQTNFDFSARNDGMHTGTSSTPMLTTESTNPKESMPSLPSRQSFRVLTECPLTVMLLFQLYPKFLKTNIPVMIPLMMDSLKLVPPRLADPSKDSHSPAGITPTTPEKSLSKSIQRTPAKETPTQPTSSKTPMAAISAISSPSNETIHRIYRIRAHELLAAQVKTLSFLTYLLRGFTDQMRPYEDVMANNVILLMKHCPSDVSTRKELLVSTRHILATEFRKGFFRHIDVMMDERMISGSSRFSTVEQLRPLGYSILADLIHHARTLLTPAQLARAVRIFSRVLHDADMDMPLSLQVNAVKLIMHLVDQIFNNKDPNPQVGRDLLLRILSSFVQKVRTVREKIPELLVNVEKEIQERSEASEGGGITVLKSTSCKTDEDANGVISSPTSQLRDLQSLLRSLFQAMKTVVWCISNYAQQREKERQRALSAGEEQFPLPSFATTKENDEINSAMLKLTNGERELVSEYIVWGLPCLRAFRITHHPSGSLLPTSPPPQYREMVEAFASSLTVLDGFNIRKTMVPNLPIIMKELDKDPELITMFKYLLLNNGKNVSYECCDLVFSHLVDNLEVLSYINTPDDVTHLQHIDENDSNEERQSNEITLSKRGQNLYKLFIIVFSSLSKYSKNETAILPHLLTFVPDCIRRSMEGHTWPGPYLSILRMLFQTLGGKFDASNKEMVPLLPTILNGFYRIYLATKNEQLRLMIVELMLTIAPRTEIEVLPHLPLLVKVLIPALQSNRGDLVNIGLRTLEAWVDSFQLDYLYPILAQQRETLCELMLSLASHLRPAPYPYGLLCLRLLGKLGGKNRLFMHEVTNQDFENGNKMAKPGLSMLFEWQKLQPEFGSEGDHVPTPFPLRLPLERAVDVLRYVADSPCFIAPKNESDETSIRLPLDDQILYVKSLFKEHAECLDLNLYAVEVMEKIKREQANSAFEVIRGVLASLLDLSADASDTIYTSKPAQRTGELETPRELSGDSIQPHNLIICNDALKLICDGLYVATANGELKEESMALLSGLVTHIIFVIESHKDCIARIDSDGAVVDNNKHASVEQNHLSSGKLQPLKPFGCFRLSGTLSGRIDPFVFNQSLVDAMSESDSRIQHAAREVMKSMIDLIQRLQASNAMDETGSSQTKDESHTADFAVGDVYVENLLSCMCQACFSQPWDRRRGATNGILELLTKMGLQWSKAYEVEILHVAMFVVKDAPTEISLACEEALRFLITITWFFFGGPSEWDSSTVIYDILSPKSSHNPPQRENAVSSNIDQASLTLIMSEIASTKHLVRFAVRHFLRIVSRDNPSVIESAIKDNLNSLKRLIFPRILRNSPLPVQVATVDSMAFMVEMAPQSFSIDDQTVLAFTAELLKMVSVADGDITDTFNSVVLIDKNGFAFNKEPSNYTTKDKSHTSSAFLKRSFTIKSKFFGGYVVVPDELPLGVQLRVATVYLFRSLIRQFPDQFFDAEPSSQVGNLRPHVVSLLFRSLTAEPPEVVDAAESALHDALLLGASEKEDTNSEEPQKSSHRLPKELIQTCIRPILINLRDHTKLTIPLLRGISRLLSLLSSWFNKALGEKMIEHLAKFTEAEKIMSLGLWKTGDEPKVAAAVMGLFSLLPQASRFAEALVKSTLRLEAAWATSDSVFRDPLARYLNRHCASAAGFFLEEHRLCNPLYSELFVDILQQESSQALRKYISGKECSVMLLNVCFERPLAIIRSEKNASSPASKSSTSAYFVAYGINPMNSYSVQRKLEIARQGIALKRSQIDVKRQEACTPQVMEHLKRELDSARLAYSQELEQCNSQKDMPTERPMTTTALELQHQGFRVVAVLMKYKEIHLQEQNDVVRALRWLWRSRGRHYRLLYQEEIHPRFSSESYMLANFLITYSEANPEDIDVLFDLIRIFLNPTSIDFNFVKEFLHRRVTHDLLLEQREKIFQRYLTLLSSEGTEENKILSTSLLILPMLTHMFQAGDKEAVKAVVSDSSISQLMESLFNESPSSSKLTAQLLRLVTVLLEHMHEDIVEYRKDLIKYVWGILKSDDASTKNYGYLAVSRFVQVFETPPKVTLQVYRSLLRSHSTPEKQMVHAALNILVPSLPNRLSPDEFEVALKYTVKIIHEEANSVQQLAHLFDCITNHHQIFSAQSAALIPDMVNSLTALGTSQNSPPEYKHLSIAVGRLVFTWKKTEQSVGSGVYVDAVPNINDADRNTMDSIINFAAKMVLSNAEGKVDATHHQIHVEITSLLKDVLSYHPNANISSIYFEKVFSFGLDESVAEPTKKAQEKNGDVKKGEKNKKPSTKDTASNKKDGNESMILLAALQFCSILLSINPSNPFLRLNQDRIIASCFSNRVSIRENGVQLMVEDFVANLVASGELRSGISTLIALLEGAIVQATCQNASVEEESDEKNHRTYMAINILEKVHSSRPDFVEPFISSLASFAQKQVKQHIQETPRATSSMIAGGMNNISQATPTLGIFELACGIDATKGKAFMSGYEVTDSQIFLEVESIKPSVRALTKSIRLISSSTVLTTFSGTRKLYLEVLSLLLDSSTCIPLLMTTIQVLRKDLTANDQRVLLTRSEQEEFLCRIAHIDFIKLPLASSQALYDMICCIALSDYGYEPLTDTENPVKREDTTTSKVPESGTNKLFAFCLISSNRAIRSIAIGVFATEILDCKIVHSKLTSQASDNLQDIDILGIPGKSPHEVIQHFLNSDMEYLGKSMWTLVLVELLLAVGKHDERLCPSTHDACLRLKHKLDNDEQVIQINTRKVSEEIYPAFVKMMSSEINLPFGRGRCISAIRRLAHADVDTSQSILQSIFQAAWQQFPSDDERSSVIESIEKVLAKTHHTQFLQTKQCRSMNAIQSLLRLVIHLRPLPVVDTFLLSALASDYNVHYEVLAYLECYYLVLQRSGPEASFEATQLLKTIHECFSNLGDRDVTLAISSAMSSMPGTKFALSLDMYGAVKKSTDAYLSLLDRAGSGKTECMPSELDLKLWEQQWIEAHKELSQWDVINEVSSNFNNNSLMIECAWKSKNWEKVKSLCGSPSIVSAIELGDCNAKMTEIYLAIHGGKLTEVENLHAQAAQLSLHKMQLLPSVGPGSSAHKELFHQFERLVELRESSQIMLETFSHCSRRTIPDLNNMRTAWRNRGPNFFESMSVWEDLYSWRFQIFDAVAKNFAWADPTTLSNLHDKSHAAITLGRIARKQALTEVSMFLMSDLPDANMSVENAFLKLREKIVTHQHSQDEAMLKGGLNLVNSTNLTFFDARQKAEFFRLKSCFFDALNDKSNAHKNYCHAVQLCPNYARAWIDWGHLCLSLADISKKAVDSKRKMNIQYMAQATACFLEAVRLDTSEQSRENIPHCLSMLSHDSSQFGYMFKAFEARAPLLLAWTWLPWIPQLLTSLCRAEAHCTKSVLMKIANDHPQALYYSLRAFFLERRDIERSKDHDATSKNEEDAQKHAEVLMSTLRKTHPVLWSRLEAILEDLIIRFRPSYEAELLVTIKALLEKAKSKLEQTSNDATPDNKAGLLESIRASLIKISTKFFNKEKPDSQKGRKTLLFEKKWHAPYTHDFVDKQTGPAGVHQGPGSIDELIMKLEEWKAKLEYHVSHVPNKCFLQETSPSLSWHSGQSSDYWAGSCDSASLTLSNSQHDYPSTLDNVLYEATRSSAMVAKASSDAVHMAFRNEGLGGHEGGGSAMIEIPGQYAPTSSNVLDLRPLPELHAKLVHFHQTLEVISTPAKQEQTVRQITMIGSDGKSYKFLLQLAIPYWTRTDERSAQLQYIMGKILKRNVQAHRRCLSVQPNAVIPVAQRMRMTANEPSYCTLDSVAYHAEGPSISDLAIFFENEVAKRIADIEKSKNDDKTLPDDVKLDVYRCISQHFVPPNIMSKYMMDTIPSIERLMQFRKMFASQLSANSFLQHAFAIIERTPSRFMFCTSTGRILAQDFRFQYNQGLFEAQAVPFRMTRCIAEFIGPFLLQGIFIPSFASISSALNAKRNALEPVLHLLLRDDIIWWYTSKTQPRHDKKMQETEHQLSDRVWKNIRYVQARIEESATRAVENAAEEAISTDPQPIDAHVRNLLAAATNEQKLSLMSASYQAWL